MDNWLIPDEQEIPGAETNYFSYYLTALIKYFNVATPYSFEIIWGTHPRNIISNTDMIIHDVSYAPYLHHPIEHSSNKPILYIGGEYDNLPSEWVYFPFWFAVVPLGKFKHQFDSPIDSHIRKFKFSCLNKSPKAERIWFYCQLHKSELFSDTMTSFYANEITGKKYINGNILDLERRYFSEQDNIDQATIDYFIESILPTLPHCIDDERDIMENDPQFFSHGINHPAFSDAYINIISEHLYQKSYLSEKTVKPIAAKQLFLMAGPCGAISQLEKMGFDTYSDIIDHKYYDNDPDWQSRLTKMLEVAEDIGKQDIMAMHISTESRRIHNREYLFSKEFQSSLYNPMKKWVDNTIRL